MNPARLAYPHLLVVLIVAAITAAPSVCSAQDQMSYMLLDGSTLTDECIICGRPPLIVPLRGTFILRLREENPLFTTYDVHRIIFDYPDAISPYHVTGEGTYEVGGEVAIVQRMQLKAQINERRDVALKSDYVPLQRAWPMIEIEVREPADPPNPLQVFYIHIVAAPVREIWFSTTHGFTSGALSKIVSAGDLLSHGGHVVRSNADLVGRLSIMPMVPDLGLDAVDVLSGCELVFSCEIGEFSETLGPLQHGDLLSEKGRIVRTNQQLTAAFSPMPPAGDAGLDAAQVMEDGEVLFSIEQDLFSEKLGVLHPGDLLSDKGRIVRTNKELLAKFEPVNLPGDAGLDAIHVWRNGEIWFSTEVGFQSKPLGTITDGDLLSDSGYIVFRNLELLGPFMPLEDLANFGLDGLFIVAEDNPSPPDVDRITLTAEHSEGDLRIEWLSDAKVCQLERADEPGGPYIPLGPINPDTEYVDVGAILLKQKSFYRLRLW